MTTKTKAPNLKDMITADLVRLEQELVVEWNEAMDCGGNVRSAAANLRWVRHHIAARGVLAGTPEIDRQVRAYCKDVAATVY